MPFSKADQFDKNDLKLSEVAKALSHPARIAILRTIAENERCICGDIVGKLPLAQSTISQHLKDLKKAELIVGEVEGPKSCYCINWKMLNQFSSWFKDLFGDLNKCCR